MVKIQIEITEEVAALVFANNWGSKGGKSLAEIVRGLVESSASEYRAAFPGSVSHAVADYRESLNIACPAE